MIRLPMTPHPMPGSAERPPSEHDRDLRRGTPRQPDGRERSSREASGGRHRSGEDRSDRAFAFSKRLRDRMQDSTEHQGDREQNPDAEARLLVMIEAAPLSLERGRVASATPESGAAPTRGSSDPVERLTTQLEELLRAARIERPDGPVSVQVSLDGLVEGLSAVTVQITPDRLDVTLIRAVGSVPNDLADQARELAARLHGRFANRKIRVLERVSAADTHEGDAQTVADRPLGWSGP